MHAFPRGGGAGVGLTLVAGLFASCAPDFDTTRVPASQGTLGAEIFGVVCERVHVGETPTDVTFERGRAACAQGLSAAAPAPRGVGRKTTALARMRADVVAGLDTAMPRDTHAPLDRMLLNLLPLYGPDGSNRLDAMRRPLVTTADGGTAVAEDLLPQTTRAVSSLLTQISTNQDALLALERMSLRRGYRPANVAFGVLRPVLAYERADDVLDTTFRLFRDPTLVAPAGPANAQFNTTLAVLRGEFADARPSTAAESVGGTTLDAVIDLMLREDPALAAGPRVELVRRNACGFARVEGAVTAPFVDTDGNGVVDTVRCVPVNAQRQPLRDAPAPFAAQNAAATARDDAGHALVAAGGAARYQYARLDASMLGAVLRQLPPLLAGPDVPALRFLHGAQGMFGARVPTTRAYSSGTVAYSQFTAARSPLVDLVHAVSVLLSHRDIGAILAMARDLMAPQRERATARLIGALLEVKAISDRHPDVTLDPRSNLWDDVMQVARRIAEEPGLLEDVLDAVADGNTPLPEAGLWQPACRGTTPMQGLSRAFGTYMSFRDRIEPDWSDASVIGGAPAWNAQVTRALTVPVDRARPDTSAWMRPGSPEDNRSAMGRIFHLVDDLNGAHMCNKQGASVRPRFRVPIIGNTVALSVPGATSLGACTLVEIPDAATFFVRSVVGGSRAVMPMELPGLLDTIVRAASAIGVNVTGTLDTLVQDQSQITGFSSLPTPFGVARMVFNPNPNGFVTDLLDPVLIRNSVGVDPARNPEYVVRNVHRGTLFAWETNCFYDAVRPVAGAFVRHDRQNADDADPANDVYDPVLQGTRPADIAAMHPRRVNTAYGSKLFADLFTSFHRYWPTARSGDYQSAVHCVDCREGRNYAITDGLQRYEPVLTEVLQGDLLPALASATASLRDVDPGTGATCLRRNARVRCNGVDVLATAVRALVMPNPPALGYVNRAAPTPAFSAAPAYRDGSTRTLWSDGTTPQDATLYFMFADALNAMDPVLAADPARKASWDGARSAMVDQLLTVDGVGASAQLRNRATAPITRVLVGWLRDRVEAHRAAGDLDRWLRDRTDGLGGRLERTIQGPSFAAGVDLTLALYNDREARATMSTFLTFLLSDGTIGDASRTGTNLSTTLAAVADLLQMTRADQDIDPFLHVMAPAMEPRNGTVPRVLRFLDRARGLDPDRALTHVLGNLTRRPATGDPLTPEPLSVVVDAVADTHRGTPGDHGPLSATDFNLVLRNVAEFFTDDRRGMEQFYAIIQHRRLP